MATTEELEALVTAEFAAKRIPESDGTVVTGEGTPDTPVTPPAAETHPAGDPYLTKSGGWQVDVDLGDGSGLQSYKNATLKGLISALAKAQLHASAKIRDLNKRIKEGPVTPDLAPVSKALTADEQWVLAQELQTDPISAMRKMAKETFGADPDEIREMVAANHRAAAANKFITAHPEYVGTPENEQVMLEYIQSNKLAFTAKNLEIAFEELLDAGLVSLTPKKAAAQAAPAPETRTRKRGTVGLSTSTSVATEDEEEQPHELTVEDMLKMTDEQRVRIVHAEFAKRAR